MFLSHFFAPIHSKMPQKNCTYSTHWLCLLPSIPSSNSSQGLRSASLRPDTRLCKSTVTSTLQEPGSHSAVCSSPDSTQHLAQLVTPCSCHPIFSKPPGCLIHPFCSDLMPPPQSLKGHCFLCNILRSSGVVYCVFQGSPNRTSSL